MLKCGEDIVVSRGERKTLKFWSAEDDLLKVQIVPAGEERLRGPSPARPVTYSRIPGLSEAILAHSRYSDKYAGRPSSQSGAGLHYAGNPDIDINNIFQSDNGTGVEDDYDAPENEVVSNAVKPVINKQEMSDEGKTRESQVPDSPSRIAEPTTTVATTTTYGTDATTKTTTTAQSIKLVTFFPDLQNYNPSSSTGNGINKVLSSGLSGNSEKIPTDEESVVTQSNILETNDSNMLSADKIQSATIRNIAENKYQEVPVGDSISSENETDQETTTTASKSASDGQVSSTELISDDVEGSTHTPVAATSTEMFTEEDTLSLLRESLSEILQKINVRGDPTEELGTAAPPANEPTTMMADETTIGSDDQNEIKRPFENVDVESDFSSTESTIESQTESTSDDDESNVFKSEIINSSDSEMSTTGEAFSTIQPMIILELNSEDGVGEDLEQDVTTAIVDVTNADDDIDNVYLLQNSRAPPHISVANILKEAIRNELGAHIHIENAMPTESDLEKTTTEHNFLRTEFTDTLDQVSGNTGTKTATVTSSSVPEVEKVTNEEVEATTILAQLLRDSLSQIVLDMNKGTNDKQQTVIEGLSLTSERQGIKPSIITLANDNVGKISNDKNIDTGEKKNLLNINTDSIDDMAFIMNTFSDQSGEVTTEVFSEQSKDDGILDDPSSEQYVNIKKVHMAGHQNTAESTSTDKEKEQSRMGVDIDVENSISTETPTTVTETDTIDVDYEATKDSIPTETSVSNLSNSTKDIKQDRVHTEGLTFEDLSDPHGAIQPNPNQSIKTTEAVSANISSTIWQSESVNTKEVTEHAKHSIIPEVTTEISFSESTDGFKGYEYYETLYDSLMPQIHKSGARVPIEDLFGGTMDGIDKNSDGPPTTHIPDFDTDMEPMEVDYEATKDSIPVAPADPSHEVGDHEEQIRVQTSDLDFEEMHVSNDLKYTTMSSEEKFESGNSIASLHDITKNVVTDFPVDSFIIDLTESNKTESQSDVSTNVNAEGRKEVREETTVRATAEEEFEVTTTGETTTTELEEETTAQVTVAGALQSETTAYPTLNYRDELAESDIDQERFQVQDYEATKDSIPPANENSEVADSLKDIFQMRVGNQPLNTEVNQSNVPVDTDGVKGTIVSQDASSLGKEGEESENDSMSNNILNSIASIIRHTMSASPFTSGNGNTNKITTTTEGPIYTTVLALEHEEANQKSAADGNEESDNEVLGLREDSSDDMIQIPLQIVDGQVKVSQDRNAASITVPMSALETEEALDHYLNTHLQKGSHVLIKENGSKVSINSLDELTTAMELIMGNKPNATEPSNTPDADQMNSDDNDDQTDILPARNEVGSTPEDTLKDKLPETIDFNQDDITAAENDGVASTDNISELENNISALESETPEMITDSAPTIASELQPNEGGSAAAIISLGQPEKSPIKDEEGEQNLLFDILADIPYKIAANNTQNTEHVESSDGNPIQNTVIDILEQMLFSEQPPPQSTNVGSSARQETVTEHTKKNNPASAEFSNDFNMDSLRYYSENRDHDDSVSTNNKRASQQQERKPARKDDSGHQFGGDPPFFIKLPGSPNSVPLYIEYEPVQVRYVPVQSREGTVPLPEEERKLSPTEFSSRIGTEQEINTIETDLIMNHTMASPTRSPLVDHMERVINQKTNASAAKVGPLELQDVESPGSDNNEITNKRPVTTTERTRTTESTHAHINIPLDFISRESSYNHGPDPFVVMPPPDLTSQEVKKDNQFPDYGGSDYMNERQGSKRKVISSINVANEDENKIEEEMLEVVADEPLPPGQYYSSENRGTIYGDVDLDRLNNPVFSLKTEMKRPSQEEMMNPAYTPFPITANPLRIIATTIPMPAAASTFLPVSSDEITTPFISSEVITQSSTLDSPSTAEMLVGNGNRTMLKNDIFGADMIDEAMDGDSNSASYKEPQSVAYSSIPAVDFRISYNPSDVPKFMKQNPHSFLSWYPQATHENTFHAAALTSSDSSRSEPVPSMAAIQPASEDYTSFTQDQSVTTQTPLTNKKGSARYTGNFHPNEVRPHML